MRAYNITDFASGIIFTHLAVQNRPILGEQMRFNGIATGLNHKNF
jgi:hypothetical protein